MGSVQPLRSSRWSSEKYPIAAIQIVWSVGLPVGNSAASAGRILLDSRPPPALCSAVPERLIGTVMRSVHARSFGRMADNGLRDAAGAVDWL